MKNKNTSFIITIIVCSIIICISVYVNALSNRYLKINEYTLLDKWRGKVIFVDELMEESYAQIQQTALKKEEIDLWGQPLVNYEDILKSESLNKKDTGIGSVIISAEKLIEQLNEANRSRIITDEERIKFLYDTLRTNPKIKGIPEDYTIFRAVFDDQNKLETLYYSLLANPSTRQILPSTYEEFLGFIKKWK